MCKYARISVNCYRENLTPENNTENNILLREYTTVVYDALVQKGLKVRIIRGSDNGREEISRHETNFEDESDDITYYLEVDNLANSSMTLNDWNDFLQNLGSIVTL